MTNATIDTTTSTTHRSPIFELSDRYAQDAAELSPLSLTFLGKHHRDTEIDDFTHASTQKAIDLARRTLADLAPVEPIDDIDRRAKRVITEDLTDLITWLESREGETRWGDFTSPVATIHEAFQQMPTDSLDDRNTIAARMRAIPAAYGSWTANIEDLATAGRLTPARHVRAVIDYARSGLYAAFVAGIDSTDPALADAAAIADNAGETLAAWLEETYLPQVIDVPDAIGYDRYLLHARHYTTTDVNPREIYESGLAEMDAINARMWELAKLIAPQATQLTDIADALDNDPRYTLTSEHDVFTTLTAITENAMRALNGVHFDIDPRVATCDVKIDRTSNGTAAYYISPSLDFTRNGSANYPVAGRDRYRMWDNVSTWYHEAFPGHHLQITAAMVEADNLTAYQREAWNSGYGEGWALYAERFMNDHGFLTDPGHEFGYLVCQALRAARLVVDTGLHMGYTDPQGNIWTPEAAVEFMRTRALITEAEAISEVERYLCAPGQAISYKLGERTWVAVRDEAAARLGAEFNLRAFHRHALALGSMGLDTLRAEMRLWDGK